MFGNATMQLCNAQAPLAIENVILLRGDYRKHSLRPTTREYRAFAELSANAGREFSFEHLLSHIRAREDKGEVASDATS